MNMTTDITDVAIIGAGQAGLAVSSCLSALGLSHLVLERGRVGERWRSERWPALRLLTPAWMTRLPGFPPHGAEPTAFLSSQAFVASLERYAASIRAPLRCGTEVLSVRSGGRGFLVTTSSSLINARAVVVATGACDLPDVPVWANKLPDHVHQITPDRFRRADLLPVGGVLVVGASSTGVQLAEMIARSGRPVTLAVGSHVRAPRRYRGRDIFEWLDASGFLAERRNYGIGSARAGSQPSLPLSGGGALDLATLAEIGVRIVGRALGVADGTVLFAEDLKTEVLRAEERRRRLLARIDSHIEQTGLTAPDDPKAWEAAPALPPSPDRIDLAASGIRTVVWATGYRRSYPWLKVPVLGPDGEIMVDGCATAIPGLYVLGLPFQCHRASALIDGVGRDAEEIARRIARNLGLPICLAA